MKIQKPYLLLRTALLLAFFTDFVTNAAAQCSLTCLGDAQISLSANDGTILVMPDPLLADPYLCTGFKTVEILDSLGNVIATSPLINASYVGQTLTARVTHPASGNSCTTNIRVEDQSAPTLTCRDTTILCSVLPDTANAGVPSIFENTGQSVTLTFEDVRQENACSSTFIANIIRTWSATDLSGNVGICEQHIYIRKATLSDVVFPDHFDGFVQPALACGATIDPSNVGEPSVFGVAVNVFNCSLTAIYNDIVINTCGNSYKIVRSWTVSDVCTGAYLIGVQLIKVGDFVPPTLICAADTVISTAETTCTASFLLPTPIVFDSCSTWTLQTTVSAPAFFDDSTNMVGDLPIGTTTVTYVATDACGNVSTCAFNIVVTDQILPVPICLPFTQVDLGTNGTATLAATALNQGSYDNCGIQRFEIRRSDKNLPFDSLAHFDCSDVDSTIAVVVRVYDISNNFNELTVYVTLKDAINPVIACPANLTLECTTSNYNNLAVVGSATATDNCVAVVSHIDQNNVNGCGVGTIVRTWKATDPSGRSAVCIQTIGLTNAAVFFINKLNPSDATDDVVWPSDVDISGCGQNTVPAGAGQPIILNNRAVCSSIAVTYEDQIFAVQPPACYKIMRRWTVIDWCQYQFGSTTSVGVWEYKQIIKVSNTIAPVFTSPCRDTILSVLPVQCEATPVTLKVTASDDCTPNALLRWSFKIDKNNNGSMDTSATVRTVNMNLEMGVHRLFWTVEDGCGNTKSCSYLVTVKDGKKPTPICISGVVATLVPTSASLTLTPEILDGGSNDNCSTASQLTKTLTPNVFTCANRGMNIVRLTVSDAAGNSDFCTALVRIQDNSGLCPPLDSGATISGLVKTPFGQNIAGVKVTLNTISLPATTTTAGDFQFTNLLTGENYTVIPQKDTNPLNGISTFDILVLNRHILGMAPLTSPYQLIAADVNRSGSISTIDIVQLRQLVLGITTRFPNNTSWRFVDKNFVFPDTLNPFATPFPESCPLDSLTSDQQVGFVGIKIGDLNNSAGVNNFSDDNTVDRAVTTPVVLAAADENLEANQTYWLRLTPDQAIEGLQMTLGFDRDKLEFLPPVAAGEDAELGLSEVSEGKLSVSWVSEKTNEGFKLGQPLRFRAKRATSWAQSVFLQRAPLVAEAYQLDQTTQNIEKKTLAVRFLEKIGNAAPAANHFALYQNQPNPFSETTTIGFQSVAAERVRLRVTSASGSIVLEQQMDAQVGYNEWLLSAKNFAAAGVFYYQIETSAGTAVRKMVRTE